MVDLAGQPRFFVGAAMGLTISEAMDLAINEAVSTKTDIAVSFFRLSL